MNEPLNDRSLTIIIPSRNRPRIVTDMVEYLRRELGWTCPIVLVDQSDDAGASVGRMLDPLGLQHIQHVPDFKRGTGAARNTGARHAATEWLLFLDDDVRPAAGYWDHLNSFLAENSWVDGVQGRTEQRNAWHEYQQSPGAWLEREAGASMQRNTLPQAWTGAEWFSSGPSANYSALTIGTGSGNLLISRDAFFGVGGFDERIEALGDDREFGIRLWWLGYRTCFCPRAVVFHLREAEGGTRYALPWRKRLINPDPSPGALYLYLKWLPGHPWREMIFARVLKALRRPWTSPTVLFRLWSSVQIARQRMESGPIYLAQPQPRDALAARSRAALRENA